ncbi:MFS transporter [Nonomuraea sp. PA05]|uniref:MFS transporter n=1 Tax=Nonomuraea sp. PA05 TaxID=2604466 RepID=UPI0011D63DBE|nr:MFS transporter [Nonomuraea sp. PA05]TYB58814.1 MFS transporter [Nonomuraea sp. PA05]
MEGGWERARHISRRVARGAADAGRATVRATKATAGGTVRATKATASGTARAGKATARGARGVGKAARKLTYAGGAGRTGLGRLIELSAGNSACDALVTVALASTVFFGVPVGEARGSVALYLVITMVPFALLAPFVGPILDRFRSGRRYVMAGTLFGRGLLCFAMAAAVGPGDLPTLFIGALGVLVLSKAYNVSRAAIMPSVLPADITLVSANARVALFTLVSAGVAVPLGAGLTAWLGSAAILRVAMVGFLLLGVVAVRLPRHVDSPDTEEEGAAPRWRTLLKVGPAVAEAVWANVAIRLFSGFLLFFLLFLVQDEAVPWLAAAEPWARDPFFDIPKTIALLAGAAGLGGLAGAVVANWTRNNAPQLIVLVTLALTAVTAIVTAIFFGVWTALLISLVAAFAQELGKLALDAIVQREIGEEVRSSTFGVVEAVLQLAWVFGGLVGLVLSLTESSLAGLVALAVALTAALGWLLISRRKRVRATKAKLRRQRAEAPADAAPGHPSPGHPSPGHPSPDHAATAHPSTGHASPAHTAPDDASPGYAGPGSSDEVSPYDRTVPNGEQPPRKEKLDSTKPLTNPNG